MAPEKTSEKKLRILSTYGHLLSEHGVRGSTLDALAQAVGLSKAGLLHHFRSRAALDQALIARLEELVRADVEAMSQDLEHAVSYYFTTSYDYGSELEQLVVAANRLGQSQNVEAAKTLRWARDSWYQVLVKALGDPVQAKLALLAGDGVSYHLDITNDNDDGFLNQQTLEQLVSVFSPNVG